MNSKLATIGMLTLVGCVQSAQLVKNGPMAGSEFRGAIVVPDQDSVSFKYDQMAYSNGQWLQSASWGSPGGPKRLLMKVVDFNGISYVTHREPFSVSILKLDKDLNAENLKFGKSYAVKSASGAVSGQSFTSGPSECLGFFQGLRISAESGTMGAGDGGIHGYYCAPEGVAISEATAMKILSSIHLKN